MSYLVTGQNPVICSDFPDADVIRVEDTFYMVSTTMHFMPGCVILRSYDLINWHICSYVYDKLDSTEGQRLADGKGVYGKGMWAATIRYHEGMFYICFVANDTGKTYIYRSENIEGPWRKNVIEGSFFHDSSILFDDDGRVYIAYGNRNIYITELNSELTAVKEGGLHRLAVTDENKVWLGYEGSHFYKINGKYYLFFIHWPQNSLRTESCFTADSIDGEFTGRDVLCSDLNEWNSGTAQGGIVDTQDGEWYSMVFQDHGAIGRIPVLVPVHWENDFPVFGTDGKAPEQITVKISTEKAQNSPKGYEGLNCNGFFEKSENGETVLKKPWQWNHEPDDELWSGDADKDEYAITSGRLCVNLVQAVNTLTQRTYNIGRCCAEVSLNAADINEGDFAGFCALQGNYGFIGATKENGRLKIVTVEKKKTDKPSGMGSFNDEPGMRTAEAEGSEKVRFRMEFDFSKGQDTVRFMYACGDNREMTYLGDPKKLFFTLDHFTGCRVGMFLFSTVQTGGRAVFSDFRFCE